MDERQQRDLLERLLIHPPIASVLHRLQMYDRTTWEHSLRTARLTIVLGILYGLRGEDLWQLGCGGVLHDIGKLWVPREILNSTGPLTDREYRIIQLHPVSGAWYLNYLGGFSDTVLALVEQHHVNCDGTGYPQVGRVHPWTGLLRTADSYDAMVSRRSYQYGKTPEEALLDLQAHAQTWYDADAVRCIERWIGNKGGYL